MSTRYSDDNKSCGGGPPAILCACSDGCTDVAEVPTHCDKCGKELQDTGMVYDCINPNCSASDYQNSGGGTPQASASCFTIPDPYMSPLTLPFHVPIPVHFGRIAAPPAPQPSQPASLPPLPTGPSTASIMPRGTTEADYKAFIAALEATSLPPYQEDYAREARRVRLIQLASQHAPKPAPQPSNPYATCEGGELERNLQGPFPPSTANPPKHCNLYATCEGGSLGR